MSKVEFVLNGASFLVESLAARQACHVLAHNPQRTRFIVESKVTVDIVREFISAIEGETVKQTKGNIEGLSALCEEFKFDSLL
jgi:hypothetical protein